MKFREQVIARRGHPDTDAELLRADIEDPDHIECTGASRSGARVAWLDAGGEPTDYRLEVHTVSDGDKIKGAKPTFAFVKGGTVVTLTEVSA